MAHALASLTEPDTAFAPSNGRNLSVQQRRVLIVDDETSVRDYLDQVLRDAGYITLRAIDGEDALEFVERVSPFDLLLTDLVMPRMRGTELARRLRLAMPDLKVLYFTGYVDQLFKEKGILSNDEAYLEKPADIDGLLEAVALLLNGHMRSPNATHVVQ